LKYIWIFKIIKNIFWSFHSVGFFNTNCTVQKSASSDQRVNHTGSLKLRSPRAKRKKTIDVHAHHILSRADCLSQAISWASKPFIQVVICAKPSSCRLKNIHSSTPANQLTFRIGFLIGSAYFDSFSTKSNWFPTILTIPDSSTMFVFSNSTPKIWYSHSKNKITTNKYTNTHFEADQRQLW